MSPGLLNLTEADETGFDPLPAGSYICEIVDTPTVVGTKGGDNSALPKDTPMLKIQWKVLSNRDGETIIYDDEGNAIDLEKANRRFFSQNVIPPAEIDGKPYQHYKMMNGQLVRLFKSLGYADEEIKNKKGFDPDLNEMVGRQSLLTVGRDMEYSSNPVKGFKPVPETAGSALV
jgi:hypothetical protein